LYGRQKSAAASGGSDSAVDDDDDDDDDDDVDFADDVALSLFDFFAVDFTPFVAAAKTATGKGGKPLNDVDDDADAVAATISASSSLSSVSDAAVPFTADFTATCALYRCVGVGFGRPAVASERSTHERSCTIVANSAWFGSGVHGR
jgi:hypothetical protein